MNSINKIVTEPLRFSEEEESPDIDDKRIRADMIIEHKTLRDALEEIKVINNHHTDIVLFSYACTRDY